MKKLAFVLGYAGGILALVFSLVMIYTVPAGLLTRVTEDIKYDMENENIIALNEVGIFAQDDPITDFSQKGLIEYAKGVAEKSEILNNEDVYEESVVFAYNATVHGLISAVLIGVSIIFALLGLIGALTCRKASTGSGVIMLISSLVLLLCAIYTGTVLPMIAASVLLAGAGIVVFIPANQAADAQHNARRRVKTKPQKPQQYQQPYAAQYAQQYPQQPYQQPYAAQPYPQQPYTQPVAQPAEAPVSVQSDVPFPDEEVQVFAQPADAEVIKE